MVESNLPQILFVKDEGIDLCTLSSEVKSFSQEEEAIGYVIENYRNFESFDIYMPGGSMNQLVQSGISSYAQVKRVTFYFGLMNDIEQAKKSFNIIPSEFHFCLKREVANRIQKAVSCNALKSYSQLNSKIIKLGANERRCRVQRKQESLVPELRSIVSKHNVGFDAGNFEMIGKEYLCELCGYILRNPVQLCCGHRFCKSCAENSQEDTILCQQCTVLTSKTEIWPDKALRKETEMLNIICLVCTWNGPLKEYEDHINQWHSNSFCEYCARMFKTTQDINIHQRTSCPMLVQPCILKDYGCSHRGSLFQLEHHYLTEEHQLAIVKILSSLESSPNVHYKTDANQLQGNETINRFADTIQGLNEDVQQLKTEMSPIQDPLETLTQATLSLQSSIQKENALLKEKQLYLMNIQQDLASLEEKFDDLRFTSTDATLTWKINCFEKKIENIRSKKLVSIYSPPWYSSNSGYKMRAGLCLHSDSGNMYISLCLIFLPGQYDNLLPWPFNYRVNFCLYDQTSQQRHIIDIFRPDPTSNIFQRPRFHMNIAGCIPKFCPLATLEQENSPYIREDTIFIKVMVDFGNLPDTSPTYAFSLNPGIPTHLQYEMIQAKANKSHQSQ